MMGAIDTAISPSYDTLLLPYGKSDLLFKGIVILEDADKLRLIETTATMQHFLAL